MDIACPNCAATYRVPDTLIDGVNALRCAACAHVWIPQPPPPATPDVAPEAESPPPAPEPPPPPPEPEPPEPPPPEPAPPEPEPQRPPPRSPPPIRSDAAPSLAATRAGPPDLAPRRRPEAPRRRGTRPALSVAWTISIALVAACLVALVVYRAEIAAAWPPFARLGG